MRYNILKLTDAEREIIITALIQGAASKHYGADAVTMEVATRLLEKLERMK